MEGKGRDRIGGEGVEGREWRGGEGREEGEGVKLGRG